jgi:hypothetical protein
MSAFGGKADIPFCAANLQRDLGGCEPDLRHLFQGRRQRRGRTKGKTFAISAAGSLPDLKTI